MDVTSHASATDFLDAAGGWLEKQEAANGLMLGLAARLARTEKPPPPKPVMMTVSGPDGLEGAALMTPPRGVVLYGPGDEPKEAIVALAKALIAGGHSVPECVGAGATAGLFAEIWCDRTGATIARTVAQRIYELREVRFPRGVAGSPRLARAEDVDLLARWTHEFSLAVGEKSDAKAARTSAEKGIAGGRMLLWEHQGQPVSLAAAVRPTRHGVGICRVYTPPEHREHGFASACVAELSQRQLDAGREFCCLYTELANPISNSIYQKIGYIPVTDSTHCRFATAAAGSSESIEVARD